MMSFICTGLYIVSFIIAFLAFLNIVVSLHFIFETNKLINRIYAVF